MVCGNFITISGQLPDVAGSGCKHGVHERGTKFTNLNLIGSPEGCEQDQLKTLNSHDSPILNSLGQAADKISLKFSKKLTGKSEEPPRWRKCVGAASGLTFLRLDKL